MSLKKRIIFFEGVQCVGKTSLLHELEKKYKVNVLYLDLTEFSSMIEGMVDFPWKNLSWKDRITMYKMWYHKQIRNEIKQLDTKYPILIDRSPLAPHIYQWINDRYNPEEIEQLIKIMNLVGSFDNDKYVFLFPSEYLLENIMDRMYSRNNKLDKIDMNFIKNSIGIFKNVYEEIPKDKMQFTIGVNSVDIVEYVAHKLKLEENI